MGNSCRVKSLLTSQIQPRHKNSYIYHTVTDFLFKAAIMKLKTEEQLLLNLAQAVVRIFQRLQGTGPNCSINLQYVLTVVLLSKKFKHKLPLPQSAGKGKRETHYTRFCQTFCPKAE